MKKPLAWQNFDSVFTVPRASEYTANVKYQIDRVRSPYINSMIRLASCQLGQGCTRYDKTDSPMSEQLIHATKPIEGNDRRRYTNAGAY
jgi:hypothetical protein